ncbi:MAG: glycosyltransferase family 2 protein [Acidobacteria bacterium]|nr:glycosyltransferase family 2 protein [Acidobacteriota bacterium]MCB9396545.1 glycosyltransferase family 2 protein [Acidobacteriota bacterium]
MNPRLSTPVSRPKITAIVTSFNEEKNIGECLQSLAWCDDIMLVDSFSSDRTVELAKLIPRVRVVQRHYFGAAAQKNWAIDQIKEGWVLILDADERVSPELRWEIESLLAGQPKSNAYTLHRQVYFMHRKIRYSGWQHDRVARLFLAGQAHYENKRVHAKLLTNGEAPRLRNSLIHFMADDFHEYARRILKYSYWGGAQLWRDGKRANFMQILPRSLWRFIRTYFLQLGILDGMHGMVFCLLQAYGTYMKWAMVWGWTQQQKAGQEPVLPEFEEAPNLRPLVFPSQIRSSL